MALTRKFLSALGIEADKIEEIIEAHTETVEALKKERETAKETAEQYKQDAEKLPTVQKELDEIKAANAGNPYKEKYEKEHKDFEDYKAEVLAKETKAKKVSAYKQLLKDAGVSERRIDAIVKVSAVDDVELDEEGHIKDSDKLKEAVTKEWSDFIQTEEKRGAEVGTPPAGSGGGKPLSRAAQVAQKHYEAVYGMKGDNQS